MRIADATTDEQIDRCFPVMAELRTHLVRGDFVARVRRQMTEGYRLTFLEEAAAGGSMEVVACAGWRIFENLYCGRHLYVDDLVSVVVARSRGHGKALIDRLVELGRTQQCKELHLDSGVQRFGAHRFYLRERFDIVGHHFARKL